jgi:hypothetical protein
MVGAKSVSAGSFPGMNENVDYLGRRYHVQTEVSSDGRIATHLFHGGTILSTRESPDAMANGPMEVVAAMRALHDEVKSALTAGRLDEAIVLRLSKLRSTLPPPWPPARRGLELDEDRLSEAALYDVVLDHVASVSPPSERAPESWAPSSVRHALGSEPPESLDGLHVDARIKPNALLPLLERIEAEGRRSGAFLFAKGGQHAGAVLVDGGRICWAVAERMRTRLTDLLRRTTRPPVAPEIIEQMYARCRDAGTPLGEALVAAGMITPDNLARTLRTHSAEALGRLAMTPSLSIRFQPHRGLGYDAQYTFSPVDLLVAACGLRNREIATTARAKLRATVPSGACGAAFAAQPEGPPLPLALVGDGPWASGSLLDLGRFACANAEIARLVDPDARSTIHTSIDGHSLVTWRSNALTAVAVCADRSDLGYVLAVRARKR